jgi:predicted signal transduction protein with EAL and GGDEF domain
MAAELGSRAMLCRMGGDEFAVVLRYGDTSPSPVQVAESLQACMIQPFPASGTQVAVGASIGISSYPLTASDDTTLLRQADSAMYIAKRSGANMVVVYTPEVGSEREEQNQLLTELKMAVARGEIYLEYQPQYELRTGRLMRFEALARWNSPVLGKVPPNKFIPVAEESRLMIDLGAHLLEMACRDAVAWNEASGRRIPVAVNVSSVQLRGKSFVESVLEITRRTGLDPTLLELEMTESITLNSRERAVSILTELRDAGVKLALDDFGTGYSSLSYLGDLPFDRLKVDRSFLRKADLGRGVPALMNAVLSVAHALSMTVVVEGVETVEELEFVTLMGADEVQGYLTGRPSTDPQRVITGEAAFVTQVQIPAQATMLTVA